jgi:hypothetical protein
MLLQKNVRQNPRGTKTAIWIKTLGKVILAMHHFRC